jgi:hypothetical protein
MQYDDVDATDHGWLESLEIGDHVIDLQFVE